MTMEDLKFTHQSHIRTTRDRLWQALTDPNITEKYWSGNRLESDWAIGSPVRLMDGEMLRDEGEVLECIAGERLAYTWRPRFAIEFEGDDATPVAFAEADAAMPTRVLFTIQDFGPQLWLTLQHENFAPDSKLFPIITFGWPFYMSSLKSLLETGSGLDLPAGAK